MAVIAILFAVPVSGFSEYFVTERCSHFSKTVAYPKPVFMTLPIHLRILLAAAVMQALSFITVALYAAVPIPILDIIDITHGYVADGFSWPWLVQVFNQHSIVVPRLLLMADIMVTGGHMTIFTTLGLTAWLGIFIIVVQNLWVATPTYSIRLLGCGLLAFVVFRCFLLESIVINNGFNYLFAAFFAVVSFSIAATVKPSWSALAVSSLAALASGLCLVNGVLAIPIAAIIAGLRNRRVSVVLPFGIAMFIAASFYLLGRPESGPTLSLNPLIVLQSLTSMFAAPWVRKIGLFGQLFGMLMIFLALITLILILRRPSRMDAINAFAAAMLMFGLGSASLIAIGRPELTADIGVVGRYALWPALVHAGIILFWIRLPVLATWFEGRGFRALIITGVLLLAIEQLRYAWMYIELGQSMQQAAVQLRAGERSPALFETIKSASSSASPVFDLYAARGLYGFR